MERIGLHEGYVMPDAMHSSDLVLGLRDLIQRREVVLMVIEAV